MQDSHTIGIAAYCPVFPFGAVLTNVKSGVLETKGHRNEMMSPEDFDADPPANFYQSLMTQPRTFHLLFPPVGAANIGPRSVFRSTPLSSREGSSLRQQLSVCTVLTRRSTKSGLKLFLFVRHYLALGYTVIVYDRFGAHREDLAPFLLTLSTTSVSVGAAHGGEVKYFPFTALQRSAPTKFSSEISANKVPASSLVV